MVQTKAVFANICTKFTPRRNNGKSNVTSFSRECKVCLLQLTVFTETLTVAGKDWLDGQIYGLYYNLYTCTHRGIQLAVVCLG